MKSVIVVGTGIFGSIIARELSKRFVVITIDSKKPLSGSKPAACLMKPSWFSGMGKDVIDKSFRILEEYGIDDIKFKVGPLSQNVHWINPKKILIEPDFTDEVISIEKVHNGWQVNMSSTGFFIDYTMKADYLVIAAGVWSEHLVKIDGGQQKQAGVSFIWSQEVIEQPVIKPWAPYKQFVAFNRGDGVWAGDGTAIKYENWTDKRVNDSYNRCHSNLGYETPVTTIVGLRPYTKNKPCYLKKEDDGLWIATGGAKNGTVAAGYCAYVISRDLND